MRILFDGTLNQCETKYHGGGEYSNAVFLALLKHKDDIELEVFYNPNNRMTNIFFDICKKNNIKIYPVCNAEDLKTLIADREYSKVYSALLNREYYDFEMPEKTKLVFTIHGLRALEMLNEEMPWFPPRLNNILYKLLKEAKWLYRCKKDYAEARSQYAWQIKTLKNKAIITDSQHSKYSIISHFHNISGNDIKVFYAPAKLNSKEINETVYKNYDLKDRNYGLLIHAGRVEKNVLRGLIAYDKIFGDNYAVVPKDYKVIVLGAIEKSYYKKYLSHMERFIFEEYLPEEELEGLYKHAQLFLYPTLNEGFGYPPLEAMKYGTLSACSAITSVPEICGDSVLYFNPIAIEEIENRILQSFDENIIKEKRNLMMKQYNYIRKCQDRDLKNMVEYIISC